MSLSPGRIHPGGETPHAHERAALDKALAMIPDGNPFHAWPLQELHEPSSGRLHEIDLLVLGRRALYLIEIKSHPGRLTGDLQDWTFRGPEGEFHLRCPYSTTTHKTRVLAGLLRRILRRDVPWVAPIIYVDNATELALEFPTPVWLRTDATLPELFLNDLPNVRGPVVSRDIMARTVDALATIGLKKRIGRRMVGQFVLGDTIAEGPGIQDFEGTHVQLDDRKARIRSYLVPRQTTKDRQAQLRRAAEREAKALSRIGEHPNILKFEDFVVDAPLGPAIRFEAFSDGEPLDRVVRLTPDLSFDERLLILTKVVDALDYCHRCNILHRNLSPGAVLVRFDPKGRPEVRLDRFHTSARADQSSFGTQHVSELADPFEKLFQAPEVLSDPNRATVASDLFSLGLLMWFLFTGKKPAGSLPERARKLREGTLSLGAVRGDLAVLDGALAAATRESPAERGDPERGDGVRAWLDHFILEAVEQAGESGSAEVEVDPLEAERGDQLAGGLEVVRSLGQGASARVLLVRRREGEGREMALKVPHDEGCGERLASEAGVLKRMRHPRIVELIDELELAGRRCLLLSLAGDQNLDDLLRLEGTFDLDTARRYGEDLLGALTWLEEQGVVHRDIKPANLAVGETVHRKRHLTLFDFSLAADPPDRINTGTPAWRDPWLHTRGRWDAAADRFAAAAVLYRMLTGDAIRHDPDQAELAIDAERFDADLRGPLATFFTKAFAPDAGDRHTSAEALLEDWRALFRAAPEPSEDDRSGELPATLRPDSSINALPLSTRARNVLDRAGVVNAADLARLPRNHLTAVRGCGAKVAREIVELVRRLGEHGLEPTEPPEPVLVDRRLPRLGLADPRLELTRRDRATLRDGGLKNSLELAACSVERLDSILGPGGAERVRAALLALLVDAPEPGSLEDWLQELLGAPGKPSNNLRHVRVLVGHSPLPKPTGKPSGKASKSGKRGRPSKRRPVAIEDVWPTGERPAEEVAKAIGISRQGLYQNLRKLRERWQDSAAAAELIALVEELQEEITTELGPACRFGELAERIAARRAPAAEGGASSDEAVEQARVLTRVALELEGSPLHQRRIAGGLWVAWQEEALVAVAALGLAADALAGQEPLPPPDAVAKTLREAGADTPLAELGDEPLVELAARASKRAAVSARLELYPRGLDASRALSLSGGAVGAGGLTEDALRERVRRRYPEAKALPSRPDLDALVAVHGLIWIDEDREYRRRELRRASTVSTGSRLIHGTSLNLPATGLVSDSGLSSEERDFEDALRRGVRRGRFRVLQVPDRDAERAAIELGRFLGVEPRSLDAELSAAIFRLVERDGVEPATLHATDAAGPQGPHWHLMTGLAAEAASEVIEAILRDRRESHQLLVHPGLLARYGLQKALDRLVERGESDEGGAIVLLVPSWQDGAAPSINRQLAVPAPLPGQRLRVPASWTEHRRRLRAAS